MEKTLGTIQIFAKVCKVISIIALVACIVGLVGCSLGIVSLAAGVGELVKLGNTTIYGLIENEAGVSTGTMYAQMAVSAILCIGGIIVARRSKKYFANELKAGTPFTFEGAAEMFNLGICAIVVPIASIIIAEITFVIISYALSATDKVDYSNGLTLGLGITFIVVSFICKYGAEISERNQFLSKTDITYPTSEGEDTIN